MMHGTPYAKLEDEEQTKKDGVEAAAIVAAPVHSPVAPLTCAADDVGFASQPAPVFPLQQPQQQQWHQARVLPQLLPSQVMVGVNMGRNVEQWPQALPLHLHYLCSWTSPPPPPPPPPPQQPQSPLSHQWQPLTLSSSSSSAQYSQHADCHCVTPSGILMQTLDDATVRQQQQEPTPPPQPPTTPPPQPPSYIVWSLVTFLFFCSPLGTAALIASLLVRQAAAFAGGAAEARRASLLARRLNATATVLGPIIWIAFIIMAMRLFLRRSSVSFA